MLLCWRPWAGKSRETGEVCRGPDPAAQAVISGMNDHADRCDAAAAGKG